MDEQLASVIWDELKRYINTVDRSEAAESLVSILIDNDASAEDIRSAFAGDKDIKNAIVQYLNNEEEEVDDMLWLADETLAQHRVLRRNANRAGVQVANAHQDAALDNQRSSGETVLLSSEECRNNNIAPGFHGAVYLNHNAVTKTVQQ